MVEVGAMLGLFVLLGVSTRKFNNQVKLLLIAFLAVVIMYTYLAH